MKKKQEQASPYVAVPNKFFAADTKYFATDDEWLLFYHLGTLVSARDTFVANVNVELLYSFTKWDISNSSRGKGRVRKSLIGLRDKGYIQFECEGEMPLNTALLKITLINPNSPAVMDAVKSNSWTYKGYTRVYEEMFEKTNSVTELKVLTYVTWRLPLDNYAISYSEWESVLNVSHSTAVRIIEQCHAKGLITKMRGDYYLTESGETRQKTNKYLIPSEIDPKKEMNTKKKANRASTISTERREHQWFETQIWLNDNDFYVYVTSKCEFLKAHAERRIHAISISGAKGKRNMIEGLEKAESRYKQELAARKQKIRISEEEKERILEEYEQPRTFESRSIKSPNNDYSYLLDGNDSTSDEFEDEFANL